MSNPVIVLERVDGSWHVKARHLHGLELDTEAGTDGSLSLKVTPDELDVALEAPQPE